MALRIAFLGTAGFAVPSLSACLDAGHDVAAVVTQPDRPGDRGRPAPRPVGDLARERGLRLLQPARIREPAATAEVLDLGIDALVVAAYGQILPAALLDGPRLGGVNVHASLLPRWRGASPVAAAILAGDAETGVSIMRMDVGLDTGPVYAMRATPIGAGETAPQLTDRLALLGADLLVEVLAALERGGLDPQPQDGDAATLAPRLRREDGRVDWSEMGAREVDRRVRALDPWPGVVAPLAGAEVRVLAGKVLSEGDDAGPPGTVLRTDRHLAEVATRDGVYAVHRVQPPGRRPMDAAAYLRGRRAPAS
ncbi:MAG TPA: methionyl-tRNA formyltransferase [Candidatus Dormibacteraeota bacterium]